jgi:hypothetical protein
VSDEPPVRCIRTPHGLAPASAFDADRLDRYPIGVEVDVVPVQERWLPRQRFYWSALTCVHENLPTRRFSRRYFDVESLHDGVKVALGHIKHFVVGDGKIKVAPGSTSFVEMPDEGRFRGFVDNAFEFASTDLIPGLSIPDLRKEAAQRLRQKNAS